MPEISLRKANRVILHINAIYQNPNCGGKSNRLSSALYVS